MNWLSDRRILRVWVAVCATVSLMVAGASISAHAASGAKTYYKTEFRFGDGSSVITRVDTGEVTLTPAKDGSGGDAKSAAEVGSVTTTTTGQAEPKAETPRGFTLQGNSFRDEFHYRSEQGAAILWACDTNTGECVNDSQVNVQLWETLFGGNSTRWNLDFYTRYDHGFPYNFAWEYWCGVNVPRQVDHTCNTNDATADGYFEDPDAVVESVGNYHDTFNRSFGGFEAQYAKFPMVAYHISWPGTSVTVNVRYRGWDVRYEYYEPGVWALPPVTGTGN